MLCAGVQGVSEGVSAGGHVVCAVCRCPRSVRRSVGGWPCCVCCVQVSKECQKECRRVAMLCVLCAGVQGVSEGVSAGGHAVPEALQGSVGARASPLQGDGRLLEALRQSREGAPATRREGGHRAAQDGR